MIFRLKQKMTESCIDDWETLEKSFLQGVEASGCTSMNSLIQRVNKRRPTANRLKLNIFVWVSQYFVLF